VAVTSFVRDRGRAVGVVAALTTTMALTSAPAAFGAVDGDPIATSTVTFEMSSGFRRQLNRNGVTMQPKQLILKKGDVDPTNGYGDFRFANVTFKKGKKKITFGNLRGSVPGTVTGKRGKIFSLSAPAGVSRDAFGADVSGVNVKFLGAAAKKVNRALGLSSLRAGSAGAFDLTYQPRTVKIVSGTAAVTGSIAPGTVVSKLTLTPPASGGHCGAPTPIAPATQVGLTITFPVGGGTISPLGIEGIVQQQGGVRIHGSGANDANCNGDPSSLTQSNFAVNLEQQNIQADVNLEKGPPGVALGPRGIAITQLADPTGSTLILNPTNHTISVNGATIKINEVSADSLNLFFPQQPGTPPNNFEGGDVFGTSNLTVTYR
jgi:hypothetical protein